MKKDLDILLVEDSRTQALKFKLILEKHGYRVTVAQNGMEAMKTLLNGRLFIVITDWIMPEMDGSELCRAIRKHDFGGYVYIILLTAKDAKNDIIEGLEAGADDYLTKPADEAELVARLTTAERIIRLESSLKQRNREISRLAITDPLTQIFNRGYLQENLPKALKRALRYRQPLSVILCDLDHFKAVNDRYGHQVGDTVLKTFAQTLDRSIRKDIDWITRYGGEEFIIVLPDTGLHGATIVAERFRLLVSDMVVDTGTKDKINITASFGVAALDHETENPSLTAEDMIRAADQCLYRAKEGGRNRTVGISI